MTTQPTTPRRVQRTRRKGQPGMPPGAVYVGRGTRWGNPYRAADASRGERYGVTLLLANLLTVRASSPHPEHLVQYPTDDQIREQLASKDLACWCPLPRPGEPDHCHAAVLLNVAAGKHPLDGLWPTREAASGSGGSRAQNGGGQ